MSAVRAELTMAVPAGAAAEFEREWAVVAGWVAAQPGCLRQTLTRRPGGDYVVTSDWADDAAYAAFETSSRQDAATAGLRRLRTGVRQDLLAIVHHRETA